MESTLVLGTALVVKVTVLDCWFGLPSLLKLTRMLPSSPGAMGALGYSGIVQPQLPWAAEMMSGASPVFVNLNYVSTTSPSLMVQKSCDSAKNVIIGSSALCTACKAICSSWDLT